jgi:1-aminocyclopropane-1-carboxylate deaminase/D-cysteine desulfhydrase-like pyridoxal-dependent ACC family enzyme
MIARRQALTPTPTPLQPAPRFGAAIGREVWIKRDDIGSIGYAGNKIRKLEFLAPELGDADTLLIVGALQSNAARATAAFAAATGRRCVLVIPAEEPAVPPPAEGNALLGALLGAELRHLAARGCSSPRGALGFVAAHAELQAQPGEAELDADAIVHASSSCGTAAGLLLGRALHGGPPVVSVDVGRLFEPVEERILGLAEGAAALLGHDRLVGPGDLRVTYDFIGEGYASPTPECLEAIRLLARTEGIVCDPVYSGKALAALPSVPGSGPVVFWHTGGAQSVFTSAAAGALLA